MEHPWQYRDPRRVVLRTWYTSGTDFRNVRIPTAPVALVSRYIVKTYVYGLAQSCDSVGELVKTVVNMKVTFLERGNIAWWI